MKPSMLPPQPPKPLSVNDYARLYGISKSTLKRYRRQGVDIRNPHEVVAHLGASRQLPRGFVGSKQAIANVYGAMRQVFLAQLRYRGITEWPPNGEPWDGEPWEDPDVVVPDDDPDDDSDQLTSDLAIVYGMTEPTIRHMKANRPRIDIGKHCNG